jgi:hypothetical protein
MLLSFFVRLSWAFVKKSPRVWSIFEFFRQVSLEHEPAALGFALCDSSPGEVGPVDCVGAGVVVPSTDLEQVDDTGGDSHELQRLVGVDDWLETGPGLRLAQVSMPMPWATVSTSIRSRGDAARGSHSRLSAPSANVNVAP